MTDQPDGRVIQLRPAVSGELAQPAVAEAEATHPWLAPVPRRPVIPQWLREPDSRSAAARWWFSHVGHKWAFHLVRLPRYILRLAWHSPRGLGRFCHHGWAWVFDREGHPLRLGAVEAKDPKAYAALARIRKDRVRQRLTVLLCALIAASAAVVLLSLAWAPADWLLLAAAVMFLGWLGRRRGQPYIEPAVVSPKAERLTQDVITRALGSLSIAEINKVLRDGGMISFVSPVHRDGPGWRADMDLPFGVTVTNILDKREELASGLRRPLGATWPEHDHTQHAGRLVLWVGDQDLSQGKPPPWPYLTKGETDMFSPLPFGVNPRGRRVSVPLIQHNVLIGSLPGQGKTNSVRVLACGVALDASAESWLHELKGSGDLDPLERVSRRFISGIDDESVAYAAESLALLRAEVMRRAERMKALPRELCPDKRVTRQIANRRSLKLWPLVCIIDECQNLFSHPEFGKQAGEDAEFVIKIGRAFGVILILATQRPDKDSLPTGISGNVSIRFCLKVAGQVENDMILGTSSYKNGLRATMFRPEIDAGIGYLAGAAAEPMVVRACYLDAHATERIAVRARSLREAAGTLDRDTGQQARDVLADALALIGQSGKSHWTTLAERMAVTMPERYADLTGDALSAQLRALGVPSEGVRADGTVLKGCKREAIADAMKRVPEAP